jgi:hypothetical protein
LQRDDLSLRWFDARRALVFPDESRCLFVLPPNTPLPSAFAERLDLQLLERVEVRPDDVDPYFDVFAWYPTTALSDLMVSSSRTATVGGESLELPANVGNVVDLLGYRVSKAKVVPGGELSLLTFWRVRESSPPSKGHPMGPVPENAYGHRVTIFAHMLDGADHVVAQEDRLDAPAWNWHAGDVFVQLHRIELKTDLSPGAYRLEVGVYNDEDLARLPILVDGAPVDDHLFLRWLEVAES